MGSSIALCGPEGLKNAKISPGGFANFAPRRALLAATVKHQVQVKVNPGRL